LGYWKLNGSGSATVGASATVASATWTSPPLVSNSASALIVKPSGASVSIYNSYDAFYQNFENKTFTMEFWFSFNGLFDGSGYSKNLSSSSQYFVSNQLNVVQINNGSVQVGAVYYDYNKNTFRFKINGVGNTEAYIPVRNLNNPFYVVAGYSNKGLSIYVNGEEGVTGQVADTSLFPNRNSSSINFLINGTSLNSSASMNYVVNDLAFYDYILPTRKKRKRVMLAFHDDKPVRNTAHLGTSYFNFHEKAAHQTHADIIRGKDFQKSDNDFNLKVDKVFGIVPAKISLFKLSDNSSYSASVNFSSGAASISGYGSLIFPDFGQIVSENQSVLITSQIKLGSASSDYIFAFRDTQQNNIVYSKIQSNGFYVYQYDISNASSVAILSASSSLSSGSTYNFAFSSYGGKYFLLGNGVSASTTGNVLRFDSSTQLEIGNFLTLSSSNSYSTFKNFGIYNDQINSLSAINFTENKMYMARLTQDLSVSQISRWIKKIPISHYTTEVVGSNVTWDGMDNCLIESSADGGTTWTTVVKNSPITGINYGKVQTDVFIRVTTPFEYQVENYNQSFHELHVILYRNGSFFSNDLNYYLSPGKENSTKAAYTIQRSNQSMMMRKKNFGIKFKQESGSVNGYAVINRSPASAGFYAYGMDFWVNFESLGSPNQIIGSASTGPVIYASASKLINPTGSVYVNGNYVASNSYTITSGESYHIFYDFGSQFAGSAIYINGASGTTHSNAVYSHINLWPSAISASTASVRYQSFIGNNIASVTDSVTSSALWQPNWASSSVIAASGYKIG